MTQHATAWGLDPSVAHLNHGSYGATPTAVLEAQTEWRDRMEHNPVRFMDEEYQPALERSRIALAAFLGADPEGLVFMRNATEGSNAVLTSLASVLGPGRSVVTTNHAYNALANTIDVAAERSGAAVRLVDVPFPIEDPADVTKAVLGSVDDTTALVVIDQVTSPTGLIFPIADVIAACEPDVPVLVDGAHSAGMIPLSIDRLGASFHVGNCHKWLCSPKGVGYLWAARRYRDRLRPPTTSHGENGQYPHSSSPFHGRFDWTGTDDRTAWLVVGAAIETMAAMDPRGWPGIMEANRRLALAGREVLCAALEIALAAPDAMIGSLAAIPLENVGDPAALQLRLRHEHAVEVPVFAWPDNSGAVVRISAQRYNTIDDYHRLAGALLRELT